ncbi:MAG: hypothetical protein KME02_12640 [Aphanothece saxicola GSE-SYN-MK-01-06B]|nr:hypothetical protein [Aphanothece saxicola GSE-SYN-MK-01-06B]
MTSEKKTSTTGVSAVTQAVALLGKNQSIQVDIQEAAIELASVNESLDRDGYDPETIQAAHELNTETESKILSAANEMDEVNERQAQDIIERIDVNIELIDAKAELAEARDQLRAYQIPTAEEQ